MVGLLRYSIEEVLYSTSPTEKKTPTHADEAKGVCKTVGKLLKRFEKHSQGEELETTLMSVVEEEEAVVLPRSPLSREEKSPGGFSFADSALFETIIRPDARLLESDDSLPLPSTTGKDTRLVETPSTSDTPHRSLDKPIGQRRLSESPAQPKKDVVAEPVAKTSPPNKNSTETPILKRTSTTSPGYMLYKEMCKKVVRRTEYLLQILDEEPVRMNVQPKTFPRPETPKRSQPAPSKTTPKPRTSSLHSNSSEGSSCSTESENTFSQSARKEVLAACAKFAKFESEKLRELASGAAQCRLNTLLSIRFSDRTPEVVAVIETYTQCVMGTGILALDSLCLALVELNKNIDDKELTEHEMYAAYKFAKMLEQSQF